MNELYPFEILTEKGDTITVYLKGLSDGQIEKLEDGDDDCGILELGMTEAFVVKRQYIEHIELYHNGEITPLTYIEYKAYVNEGDGADFTRLIGYVPKDEVTEELRNLITREFGHTWDGILPDYISQMFTVIIGNEHSGAYIQLEDGSLCELKALY